MVRRVGGGRAGGVGGERVGGLHSECNDDMTNTVCKIDVIIVIMP